MKYVDEFRDRDLVRGFSLRIKEIMPKTQINIMEVCGTHTQNFFRFGLNELLPKNLNFIAGPGCPVCVSSVRYIDAAIELAQAKRAVVVTFGDMLRIPGTHSTLEKEKAAGADVRTVYSPLDSLNIARKNPFKKVVFLAVGFETTAPAIALSIMAARKEKLQNLSFFSALKLIPPVMAYLAKDKRLQLSAFLCPGHVSAIIGTKSYAGISEKYGLPCCVAGFEPLDIMEGVYMLVKQLTEGANRVDNQYARLVKENGNSKAKRIIATVFKVTPAVWRGLGSVDDSGLGMNSLYEDLDSEKIFSLDLKNIRESKGSVKCRCADVLRGLVSPRDCPLFSRACRPENPCGPCMVSQEGACNAYYKYHKV